MGFWSVFYNFVPDVWFKGINLRTNTATMLIDSLKLRRRDPKLRHALRRLAKKHTPDKIARIYAKFSSVAKESPGKGQRRFVKFQSALDNFIKSFLADYIEFRAYYLDALQLIQASLISNEREL